jgi:hypothetical protein
VLRVVAGRMQPECQPPSMTIQRVRCSLTTRPTVVVDVAASEVSPLDSQLAYRGAWLPARRSGDSIVGVAEAGDVTSCAGHAELNPLVISQMGKTTNSNKHPGTSSAIPGPAFMSTTPRRSSGTRRAGEVQELRVVSVSPP